MSETVKNRLQYYVQDLESNVLHKTLNTNYPNAFMQMTNMN